MTSSSPPDSSTMFVIRPQDLHAYDADDDGVLPHLPDDMGYSMSTILAYQASLCAWTTFTREDLTRFLHASLSPSSSVRSDREPWPDPDVCERLIQAGLLIRVDGAYRVSQEFIALAWLGKQIRKITVAAAITFQNDDTETKEILESYDCIQDPDGLVRLKP